jgi:gas vesicle protein
MRNVWKGLIVGGLTGVAAGVILDSLSGASNQAKNLGRHAVDLAPDAGRLIQSVAGKASDLVHDNDVPEKIRDAAHRVADSDLANRTARATSDVASAAREKARQIS